MRPRRKNNVCLRQRQNFGVVRSSQNHRLISLFAISKAISSSSFYISTHIIPLAGLHLPALAARVIPVLTNAPAIRLLMLRFFCVSPFFLLLGILFFFSTRLLLLFQTFRPVRKVKRLSSLVLV